MPNRNELNLTAAQAQFVLGDLLARRRVSAAEVRSSLSGLTREIETLEERLDALRGAARTASRSAGRPAASVAPSDGAPAKKKRRRQRLSPQRLAALRLQGHYLALMRQTPATKRAAFRAIRQAKGTQAAITALRKAQK
ncbi:MAG TPA: hypothetical protein VE967_07935 [Gemmatimonadaceae bacterium]|nr:hypothetical protein [Gemmatimonadaceae bacterium]